MNKDFLKYTLEKLRIKRNILFRAFAISYGAIIIGWLFSISPLFLWTIKEFTLFSPEDSYFYIMNIFGVWQTLNVVFLLFPALAIWWEMHELQKK
ncbi:MAG: hypothetical protein FWF34_02420 [Alphaproteobacteria bacterium]|nr:hypothetical protein [Alphaproteobacteria bacterium]MCL2890085.1 hypothetical protein [Alphaproteobacteria bacterium]